MQTKDAIKFALAASNGSVLGVIDEMSDAPTTFPTPNGGCHPLWVLGHLAFVEGMIPAALFGEPNAAADWAKYFGQGTEPVSDPAAYPPFAEVRERYAQLRARNLQLLDGFSESDLDKPSVAPPKGLEHLFATYGKSFFALALHQMNHRSHVTDARRAARVTV
jgi:hypothetical protein